MFQISVSACPVQQGVPFFLKTKMILSFLFIHLVLSARMPVIPGESAGALTRGSSQLSRLKQEAKTQFKKGPKSASDNGRPTSTQSNEKSNFYAWIQAVEELEKIPKSSLAKSEPKMNWDSNKELRLAIQNGKESLVRTLINEGKVNPGANGNEAIGVAAARGNDIIVGILLDSGKVDAAANGNLAIRMASANGHTKVVKLLLSKSNADPSDLRNDALMLASSNGHVAIVDVLLKDRRVNPGDRGNKAIELATQMEHENVVGRLLREALVDPAEAIPLAHNTRIHKMLQNELNSRKAKGGIPSGSRNQ
jgi:hypothetical protein